MTNTKKSANAMSNSVYAGQVTPPAETDDYSIEVRSDDGIRIWIDGRIIVDNWTNHARDLIMVESVSWVVCPTKS